MNWLISSSTPYTSVWARAVLGPAWRRALGLWAGAGMFAAVIFGPTAMQPSDLTGLALHGVIPGAILVGMWLLMFVPVARVVVRADAARYLRALPAPRWLPAVLVGVGVVGLQLPWLALWLVGEGWTGLGVVAVVTMPIVAIAAWQPRARRPSIPRWHGAGRALAAIHLRALRRRSGEALVRAAGLALLAGAGAGLFVRNNELVGQPAGELGAAAIVILLVPAVAGAMVTLAESHRATGWLADSLGVAPATRIVALAVATSTVQLAATAIATAAALVLTEGAGWVAAIALPLGACIGVATACVLVAASRRPTLATRTIVGIVVVAAGAIIAIGWLGAFGVAAAAAVAAAAVLTSGAGA